MPCVCRFFGIVIYIYCDDHAPPHFHARYSGTEALYEIETSVFIVEEFRLALTVWYWNGLTSIEQN